MIIAPDLLSLSIDVKYKDENDIRSILSKILKETNASLMVEEYITSFSDTPLSNDFEDVRVCFYLQPEDIVLKKIGNIPFLGVRKHKIPSILKDAGEPFLLFIVKDGACIDLDLSLDLLSFSIPCSDIQSFSLFSKISRILNTKVSLQDKEDKCFRAWCKKHGYEDILGD